MTLQTTRIDRAVEVEYSVPVSWAVGPSEPRPIGHRVLVQPVAAPIEVGLTLPHAGDDVDTLAACRRVGRPSEDGGFIEASCRGVHPEGQIRIRGPQDGLAGIKAGLQRSL